LDVSLSDLPIIFMILAEKISKLLVFTLPLPWVRSWGLLTGTASPSGLVRGHHSRVKVWAC
jgi:hypothetical protein